MGVMCAFSIVAAQTSYAITNPPVLTSPTSISTNTSPLTIAYVLPDAPAPGTERLIFTGSTNSYTLTLNHTSSGTYIFSIDMDDVVTSSSGHVISSTPSTFLPDDNYSITLQYQNAVLDPAASTTATNVIIDRDSPTVVSFSPALSGTNVASHAALQVTFSENIFINNGSGLITIRRASDNSIFDSFTASSANVSISGRTLTITPSKAFESDTEYYVTIANGAFADQVETSFAGITNATTWRFTAAHYTTSTSAQSAVSAPNTGLANNSYLSSVYIVIMMVGMCLLCGVGLIYLRYLNIRT